MTLEIQPIILVGDGSNLSPIVSNINNMNIANVNSSTNKMQSGNTANHYSTSASSLASSFTNSLSFQTAHATNPQPNNSNNLILETEAIQSKANIPIGNKPMILSPLKMLNGFPSVTIISSSPITNYTANSIRSFSQAEIENNPKLDFVTQDPGTYGNVPAVFGQIKNEDCSCSGESEALLILPCDIFDDGSNTTSLVSSLISLHLSSNALLSTLLMPTTETNRQQSTQQLISITSTDPVTKLTRLHLLSEEADLDHELTLQMGLLLREPCLKLSKRFEDSSVYLFNRKLLSHLKQKYEAIISKMTSLKSELIPFIIKHQEKLAIELNQTNLSESKKASSYGSFLDLSKSSVFSFDGELRGPSACGVYTLLAKENAFKRANKINTFLELNFSSITVKKPIADYKRNFNVMLGDVNLGEGIKFVSSTQQINTSSLSLAAASESSSKPSANTTTIKKAIIGNHCIIGSGVKITNSVIMDHVFIEDNAKIDGCIICPGITVAYKSMLKDCRVGSGFKILPESNFKGETLALERDFIFDL